MDRIPLINPNLVKVVSVQAEKAPTPVLKAEVISSDPIKVDSKSVDTQKQTESQGRTASLDKNIAQEKSTLQEKRNVDSDSKATSNSDNISKEEIRYKIILKIGNQQLETISSENLKKGSQLEVKVLPGPELKIISNTHDKSDLSTQHKPANISNQLPAQAALQQLLADRIPKVQSQDLAKLIRQLSQLISGGKNPASIGPTLIAQTTQTNLNDTNSNKPLTTSPLETTIATKQTANHGTHTAKQALAHLVYQSLSKQTLATTASDSNNLNNDSVKENRLPTQAPMEHVKHWLKQLPNSGDISNGAGLRNALNNTGVRAESQLSQLAQQFSALTKGAQNPEASQNEEKSTHSIFLQLQKIQQKILSNSPEPLSKNNLGNIIKNTAQSLETNSQQLLSTLKKSLLNTKTGTTTPPELTQTAIKASQPITNPVIANPRATDSSPLTQHSLPPNVSNWQNPLLNSQVYSSLTELLKDPLLQNPSSNNKIAIGQILHQLTEHTDSPPRIPLNWPERNGSEATMLRALQNVLGHIEREQGVQLQQSDSNAANNPNLTNTQNQQWLPLLIHHHHQLQLIEFFINKEEKNNVQGEKKNHWFINLHFELPKLGKLGIEISMFDNECNTTFWSESSSTLSQISHHIQPLRQRLTEQGIVVSDVQSRHGTLAKRKHNIQQHLVDIET